MTRRSRSKRLTQVPDGVTLLYDADGRRTTDPAKAVCGELLERDDRGRTKRKTFFLVDEVEIKWLPISESAFLLWVLALFVCAWIAIAILIRFT